MVDLPDAFDEIGGPALGAVAESHNLLGGDGSRAFLDEVTERTDWERPPAGPGRSGSSSSTGAAQDRGAEGERVKQRRVIPEPVSITLVRVVLLPDYSGFIRCGVDFHANDEVSSKRVGVGDGLFANLIALQVAHHLTNAHNHRIAVLTKASWQDLRID
jgi:hypothetical protein